MIRIKQTRSENLRSRLPCFWFLFALSSFENFTILPLYYHQLVILLLFNVIALVNIEIW